MGISGEDNNKPYYTKGYKFLEAWKICVEKANKLYYSVRRAIQTGHSDSKTELLGKEFQQASQILANCIANEHYRQSEMWPYGNKTGCRWNKSRDDIFEMNLVGFNICVIVNAFTLKDEFIVEYENASFVYKLNGNRLEWRKMESNQNTEKEAGYERQENNNVDKKKTDDYKPYNTRGYTVREAWEECIAKANQYYRNLKHEIKSGRDDPKTERLGNEFQDANKLLADCICNEHHKISNKWTYGKMTGHRWNKEMEDILQTSIVGFNLSVKVIDFTLHDEFMICYDNATIIYTIEGGQLQYEVVK